MLLLFTWTFGRLSVSHPLILQKHYDIQNGRAEGEDTPQDGNRFWMSQVFCSQKLNCRCFSRRIQTWYGIWIHFEIWIIHTITWEAIVCVSNSGSLPILSISSSKFGGESFELSRESWTWLVLQSWRARSNNFIARLVKKKKRKWNNSQILGSKSTKFGQMGVNFFRYFRLILKIFLIILLRYFRIENFRFFHWNIFWFRISIFRYFKSNF